MLRAVATSLGKPGAWPLLRTELNHEEIETLETLHRLSDWVVTVDRNAGIEYFDSPHEARAVYDAYVIDAVPERDDLGCLQMITSTSHLDEVRGLLDQALSFMGLSSSLRNCEFLLRELKALSGRLAMRLASATTEAHAKTSGELIALALSRAQCRDPRPGHPCWFSLSDGFFVPLDDVRDLVPAPESEEGEEERNTRADLLFVTAPARGGLTFRFVEVKYRRHLPLARSLDLVETVSEQASKSRKLWLDWYFAPSSPAVVRSLRRSRLARALRFYAEKGGRHHLAGDVSQRLLQEINRMIQGPEEYTPSDVSEPNRGYIFCPEFTQPEPERLFPNASDDTAIFLFGPGALPDVLYSQARDAAKQTVAPESDTQTAEATGSPKQSHSKSADVGTETTSGASATDPIEGSPIVGMANVILGKIHGADTPVSWSLNIAGNPHLMIAGLPGMGKTTCLVNLCQQLQSFCVTPIVFSYHDDIDSKLGAFFPDIAKADCQSLGFNPMRVTDLGPLGHIESAGLLRDIFASIFPELGDLQLETIRTAIKSSYEAYGWGPQRIALVLASQEARDFDTSLFSAVANYLILRVTEHDAKTLARNVAPSDMERRIADRLKQIGKYQALYFCEGRRNPVHVNLSERTQ